MTTFEKELQKLFDYDLIFTDARFVGRTCYGRISDNLRVRTEFVTLGYADKYEALKVSLINRNEGVVDSALLRFQEVLGRKPVANNPHFKDGIAPHLWVYQGELEWYAYKPTPADFEKLTDAVDNYLEVFREPTQTISNSMTQTMA
ncbi:MAG: hypothetical protein KGZ48_09185 [Dethiobacter sp.]|nr:hypothetical protein [Dethiobacter sp.]MBS3898415.1 hypothetical protein [Dethiobacter sp.]